MSIRKESGVTFDRPKKRKSAFILALIIAAEAVFSFFLYLSLAQHILAPAPAESAAGVPQLLSYQGRLTDSSGNPLGGTGTVYCFRYSIYDATSAGNKVWPTGTPTNSTTTVVDGVFADTIGRMDTLDYNFVSTSTLYLNVAVNQTTSTCGGSWEDLVPRQQITASGFALTAESVYGDAIRIATSTKVQIGTGAGVPSNPTLLSLDVKNAADSLSGGCTDNGSIWYNSINTRALICEAGTIKPLSNSSTTLSGFGVDGTVITAGNVVLSNSNNVTFGINGSTITASAPAGGGGGGATLSYYENHPWYQGAASTAMNVSGSSIWVAPFIVPQNISASYLRIPVSISHVSTTFAGTSANTTFSGTRFQSNALVVYSQGAGANSRSLQSVFSTQGGWTIQTRIGNGTAGSQYTVTFNISYPREGSNGSFYSTSYNVSSGTYNVSSLSMTLFTGPRWLDIPFNSSLSPGNYWLGLGRSTTSSNDGPAGLVGASLGFSYIGISQAASSIGLPGNVTNISIQIQPGLGWWTTNAFVSATASMAISNISAIANNPKPYFQVIRQS